VNVKDIYTVLERLCAELEEKKDWSAHNKAERIRAFFEENFPMALELEAEKIDG